MKHLCQTPNHAGVKSQCWWGLQWVNLKTELAASQIFIMRSVYEGLWKLVASNQKVTWPICGLVKFGCQRYSTMKHNSYEAPACQWQRYTLDEVSFANRFITSRPGVRSPIAHPRIAGLS